MEVQPIKPIGWYSPFIVKDPILNKDIRVQTVDIYTYVCTYCINLSCTHLKNGQKCPPCGSPELCMQPHKEQEHRCHVDDCVHALAVTSFVGEKLGDY